MNKVVGGDHRTHWHTAAVGGKRRVLTGINRVIVTPAFRERGNRRYRVNSRIAVESAAVN